MTRTINFPGGHSVTVGDGCETQVCSCGALVKLELASNQGPFNSGILTLQINHLTEPVQ